MSLTDHDGIAGVDEATRVAERARDRERARRPRCRASTSTPRTSTSAATGSTSEKIRPACAKAQQERVDRAKEIIANLNRHGVEVTFEDAVAKAGAADAIGRPHIAKAAGAGPDLGPFFEEYLVPGAKAFVSRKWPTAEQAVELIHEAGGVAVIAHPYWDVQDPEQVRDLVESLVRDVGLDGIETFYPPHTADADQALPRALRGVRPRPDRLVGLPRPDPQDVQPLGRLRHLRARRAAGARPAVTAGSEPPPRSPQDARPVRLAVRRWRSAPRRGSRRAAGRRTRRGPRRARSRRLPGG